MLLDRKQIKLYNEVAAGELENALKTIRKIDNLNFEVFFKVDETSHYLIHLVCKIPKMLPLLKVLLNAKVNLDVTDQEGRQPLHWAAKFENLEAAKLLLQSGARANVIDHFNKTPSELCPKFFAPELHKLLVTKEKPSLFELCCLACDEDPDKTTFLPESLLERQENVVLFNKVMAFKRDENEEKYIKPAQLKAAKNKAIAASMINDEHSIESIEIEEIDENFSSLSL